MRASMLAILGLLTLGCGERATDGQAEPRPAPAGGSSPEPATSEAKAEQPAVEAPAASPETPEPAPEAAPLDEARAQAQAQASAPAAEPADPLAPISPSGPEPGSPEADAELAELLEESTITQEEFDAAFRNNKPKVHGDQLVFGPNDRTRNKPGVSVGDVLAEGSSVGASELRALAEASLRGFEGCLAAALSENPDAGGTATLRLRFDDAGDVAGAEIHGASLGEALRGCLRAVADDWELPAAAGAKASITLVLVGG